VRFRGLFGTERVIERIEFATKLGLPRQPSYLGFAVASSSIQYALRALS
jgi:hypothetical protein